MNIAVRNITGSTGQPQTGTGEKPILATAGEQMFSECEPQGLRCSDSR